MAYSGIKTVFGISIPVIIRNGEATTKVDLEDLKLTTEAENTILNVKIKRDGNMSVYGNLVATYVNPNGTDTEIGKVKGISVYTPISHRNFKLSISNLENIDLSKGKIKVTYTSDKGEKLAESVLNLD